MVNQSPHTRRSRRRFRFPSHHEASIPLFSIPKTRSDPDFSAPQQLKVLFNWVRLRGRGSNKTTQRIGKHFKNLYRMRLDRDDGDEWQCTRALGRGGFGAVALFEKLDEEGGQVEDQIVVKTTAQRRDMSAYNRSMSLSKEAAIMAQTNEDTYEDGMLALRDFKAMDPSSSGTGEWRYYFEFCECGDLEQLRVKYKAYGRYLPEAFLWHLFYWLAKTLKRYGLGIRPPGQLGLVSWRDLNHDSWGRALAHSFILHNDIKPANIFLGQPDPDEQIAWYPVPRIGDLGLADLTTFEDDAIVAMNMGKGTTQFMPPEQRCHVIPPDNDFYPLDDGLPVIGYPERKRRHTIEPSANIFAIGLVMFQMMTLHEESYMHTKIDNYLRFSVANPNNPNERNVHLVDHVDLQTAHDLQGSIPGVVQPYSDTLKGLIADCLFANPADRIDEYQLEVSTLEGYMEALNDLPGDPDNFAAKIQANAAVWPSQNDLHDAPLNPGERVFPFPNWNDRRWWRDRYVDMLMWQPREWGIKLPHHMPDPQEVGAPRTWPAGLADSLYQVMMDNKTPEEYSFAMSVVPGQPASPTELVAQPPSAPAPAPLPYSRTPHPDVGRFTPPAASEARPPPAKVSAATPPPPPPKLPTPSRAHVRRRRKASSNGSFDDVPLHSGSIERSAKPFRANSKRVAKFRPKLGRVAGRMARPA